MERNPLPQRRRLASAYNRALFTSVARPLPWDGVARALRAAFRVPSSLPGDIAGLVKRLDAA